MSLIERDGEKEAAEAEISDTCDLNMLEIVFSALRKCGPVEPEHLARQYVLDGVVSAADLDVLARQRGLPHLVGTWPKKGSK